MVSEGLRSVVVVVVLSLNSCECGLIFFFYFWLALLFCIVALNTYRKYAVYLPSNIYIMLRDRLSVCMLAAH